MSLAEKAKRLREEHHWTLSQLSAQTGISMSHLTLQRSKFPLDVARKT
ncbi:hypothetical protein [Alicyclobacillus sp. SP_1]|nr:hypothetical protein [Alicyclobacillus sp. SP_1]